MKRNIERNAGGNTNGYLRELNLALKRAFDIVASGLGLLLLSPVFALIALAIKLTSKGPVFFRQDRLGKDGVPFSILKFRTMVVNAEHIGDGLHVRSEEDPRITSVGRFLRRYSLDELPQLVNCLNGTMSLVGPRPPVTYYPYDGYENYPEWAKKRFRMRPGITGLAQVKVRNSVAWDGRIVLDNKYVDRFSIFLDIRILYATVEQVFRSENIY
ncbi:MAG: sugar transferase [Butyrivibrio sp.]|nr:sugar transferase [Butyrivibrio sp.]